MSKKRAIATITVYVYGETEQELIKEANKKIKLINDSDDCKAELESLDEQLFGSFDCKNIRITNNDE